ncbi:MAG: hypothetical protein AAGE94_01980 [Acidobacteriota bacterium]
MRTIRTFFCKPASIVLILVTLLTAGLLATPAAAELGTAHGVVLMTGVDALPLQLSGWLVDTGSHYTATVVEAPRFGTWENETYRPNDAFWRMGGDRVVLSILSAGTTTRHTIVVLAAVAARHLHDSEDFEGGNSALSAWQEIGDANSVTITDASIEGSHSLIIGLQAGGGGVVKVMPAPPGKDITGIDQLGGRAAVNPDLPDGGGGGGGTGGFPIPALGNPFTVLDLSGMARVEMVFDTMPGTEVAFVRAVGDAVALDCAPTCATTWRPIPLGENTAIGLWFGRDGLHHPDSADETLHFAASPPDLGDYFHDRLTGLRVAVPDELAWTVGAVGGTDYGTVKLDLLETWWDQMRRGMPVDVMAEDFAGGSWDADWQVIGPIHTTSLGFGAGWGGEVSLIEVLKRQDSQAGLVDRLARSTQTIRAEIGMAFRSPAAAEGLVFTLWSGGEHYGDVGNAAAEPPVELQMTVTGGVPHLRARVRDDLGGVHDSAWLPAATGRLIVENPIVLHWWADREDGLFGGARLRVGQGETEVLGVQNRFSRLLEHGIGVWSPEVAGRISVPTRQSVPSLIVTEALVAH